MITRTITLRVRYKDWKKLRFFFPAQRFESAGDYIERLTAFMERNGRRKCQK